jgi:hypothetical protein
LGYGIIKPPLTTGIAMQEITLTLLEGEVRDIMNVLNNLPTGSNAWPLVKKIEAQLPKPEEPPKE